MADNIKVLGSSDPSAVNVATESCTIPDTSTAQVPLGKVGFGAAGTYTPVTASAGLPVAVVGTPAVSVSGAVEVTNDAGNPLPVSGTVTVNVLPAGTNTIGGVTPVASATGGATSFQLISANTTNATSVKNTSGTLYGIQVFNNNAAARYLKFFDKASAPTLGTDSPIKTILIPGGTAGAGTIVPLPSCGVKFTLGIALAITTGIAALDTGAVAASEIAANIDYL